MNDVQGVREMLAGLVVVSAVVGLSAMAAMFALALPTGMILLSYPVVCSLSLLMMAALWNIRSVQARAVDQVLRPQI